MAHYAGKRFNYWSQFGILAGLCGAGLIIGGVVSLVPLIGKINWSDIGSGSEKFMNSVMKPENAAALRWMQFITTLCAFFLPAVIYAWICHRKPFKSLGLNEPVTAKQVLLVIIILLACLPLVGALGELTEMLPFSAETLKRFRAAEELYNRQVSVIARMNDFGDYVVAVIMIAFLPAVFEEILFRGAVQNLFSRWFKMPVVAIIVTSIVFSAIHGSYLGFLSRFALSFILGWIYYRTGNLWLTILGHFANNAFAITALYVTTKSGEKLDPSKIDEHFPLWIGIVSIAVVYFLFILFEKINKDKIDRPGEEVLIDGYYNPDNPFIVDEANGMDSHPLQ